MALDDADAEKANYRLGHLRIHQGPIETAQSLDLSRVALDDVFKLAHTFGEILKRQWLGFRFRGVFV